MFNPWIHKASLCQYLSPAGSLFLCSPVQIPESWKPRRPLLATLNLTGGITTYAVDRDLQPKGRCGSVGWKKYLWVCYVPAVWSDHIRAILSQESEQPEWSSSHMRKLKYLVHDIEWLRLKKWPSNWIRILKTVRRGKMVSCSDCSRWNTISN